MRRDDTDKPEKTLGVKASDLRHHTGYRFYYCLLLRDAVLAGYLATPYRNDRGRFCRMQAHATQAEPTAALEASSLEMKWGGWAAGAARAGSAPGEGIPSQRLVFVGRKFDPPGAVGWCLRSFLSGLKKEFSICRERLGLPSRGGNQSLRVVGSPADTFTPQVPPL